jgi:hypothetical protein
MNKNLSQILPDSDSEDLLKTPLLKIRGKTMFFGNVIYQINNISSIGFVDLTTTTKIKMPLINYILLFAGVVCLFVPQKEIGKIGIILGVILIGLAIYLMVKHQSEKVDERYGMTIYSNSGTRKILTSRDKNFIFDVMLTLSNVMNSEELKAVNINFETLNMSDQSVTIGQNTGSPIVTGSVGQNLVNSVN